LKPDAPEFYPRHLQGDTKGTEYFASSESKKESKDRLKQEKEQKRQEEKTRKSHMSLATKAAKNAVKHTAQPSG
jgi:hypothetical protein